MTFRTLIRRSLRFHWRSHLGVVMGAAIGSAALIGALIVGDSVKGSLRERAINRLGWTTVAMPSGGHLFYSGLAEHYISRHYGQPWMIRSSAVLYSTGIASRPDGQGRANTVNVLGIDDSFGEEGTSLRNIPNGTVVVNRALANHLSLRAGDEIILRIYSVSGPSGEMVMTPKADAARMFRMRVHDIVGANQMGDFSLQENQGLRFNAFLNLQELGKGLGVERQANLLLLGEHRISRGEVDARNFRELSANGRRLFDWRMRLEAMFGRKYNSEEYVPANLEVTLEFANDELLNVPFLGYWGVRVQGGKQGWLEVKSPDVFIGKALEEAACNNNTNTWGFVWHTPFTEFLSSTEIRFLEQPAQPILTYLANLISVGSNAAPYSMVTAAGAPWTPPGLRDDEIVISQWLAEDLLAKPGDAVALVYYDPESGARLTERTNTFRVHSIVPMQMPWADRTLMPPFPGIEKAETTAEWDTAFPLVHKIRSQDDDYWTDWRGTPKAFITLAAGQKMWANRFGNLTAIRFPIPTNMVGDEVTSLHSTGGTNAAKPTPSPSQEGSRKPDAPTNAVPLLGGSRDGSPGQLETPHVVTYQEEFRAALEKKILATLKPEELGLRFEPVREQALKAAEQSQDFGGLFIGFSLFVIVAALLLMAMLFQFSLEQRAAEVGTFLALGFTPKQVRRLLLREGAALAFIGGILGVFVGIGYANAMLLGLTTVWRDAVGASSLQFFMTPPTLVIGLFASTLVAAFTLWLALRKQARQPARELLAGSSAWWGERPREPERRGKMVNEARGDARPTTRSKVGWISLAAAAALVGWMLIKGDTANAGAFFGAGALVLIAGLAFVNARLAKVGLVTPCAPSSINPGSGAHGLAGPTKPQAQGARKESAVPSVIALALRGLSRRRSRSVATAAMLASGTFLIVSIGVFRLDANRDATLHSSGTGGFALIGESTMPVVADLNTKAGRETFALNENDFKNVDVVQFRVRAGDEASCLNLNRAQKPRLLGVKPGQLEGRFTFTKGEAWQGLISTRLQPGVSSAEGSVNRLSGFTNSWPNDTGLKPGANEIEIPAIGDAASIEWAMGKKVGETIDYVDERGQTFKVRIVGAVANSILQGQLIIDEAEFVKRFPGESGYKYFLIDAPTNRVADVSAKLSRALQDAGLEVTSAPQRLAQFNAVQNTYLGTFQILGGLGLLLGSAGLGIVVLRNVLERRGELAVLLAVGWPAAAVRRLVLLENVALLGLGLLVGVVAAAIAVLPGLFSAGTQLPWLTLSLTLALVLANGFVFTWLATRFALRGDLLAALRNE